jgi:hypothetical protein
VQDAYNHVNHISQPSLPSSRLRLFHTVYTNTVLTQDLNSINRSALSFSLLFAVNKQPTTQKSQGTFSARDRRYNAQDLISLLVPAFAKNTKSLDTTTRHRHNDYIKKMRKQWNLTSPDATLNNTLGTTLQELNPGYLTTDILNIFSLGMQNRITIRLTCVICGVAIPRLQSDIKDHFMEAHRMDSYGFSYSEHKKLFPDLTMYQEHMGRHAPK